MRDIFEMLFLKLVLKNGGNVYCQIGYLGFTDEIVGGIPAEVLEGIAGKIL